MTIQTIATIRQLISRGRSDTHILDVLDDLNSVAVLSIPDKPVTLLLGNRKSRGPKGSVVPQIAAALAALGEGSPDGVNTGALLDHLRTTHPSDTWDSGKLGNYLTKMKGMGLVSNPAWGYWASTEQYVVTATSGE